MGESFQDAIRAAGLIPPAAIEPGRFYRFNGDGKRNGNTAGWCKLFPDGDGGIFGDWSSGLSEQWHAKADKPQTGEERDARRKLIEDARREAEREHQREQAEAAARAESIWQKATPADSHAYLSRKQVRPHGLRLYGDALAIPLRVDNAICSLQFISPDGSKKFLSGGRTAGAYFGIGKPDGVLCIAEGYATGATIHEATGHAVAVAFNAGNLEPVAKAMRAKFPDATLIVCADDDHATEGNPGLTKATAAAHSVGGLLAVPDFGANRPEGAKDFNDLALALGTEAVQRAIANASEPPKGKASTDDDGWPEPQALSAKIEPEPYPLEAMPEAIRAAVQEVVGFVKAPIPMVASSALAALSLSYQAHADAKRLEKLQGPIGLFVLVIADSGERKSTCDGFFTKTILEFEEAQAEAAHTLLKDHRAASEAWEAKRQGIKEKIRQLAKDQKPTAGMESALCDLEHDKPEPPRIPRLLYADATPEALAYGLAKQWPSGGVVSAEAGIVFGSHGMGKDSVMRNLGLLNQLWDGKTLTIDRRSTESFTVRGARLTVALQVQEPTLREFFARSGALARGTGFLARFLVAWPESTQGMRQIDPDAPDGPATWPHLAEFHRRIAAILHQPAPIDDGGALIPPALPLTPEAKAAWVAYHNAIESELANGGELFDVRDVASKTADNAARLAGLFQMFEGAGGAIGLAAFEAASRITAWHLHESRRFFGELALPAELASAARLDSWLIEHCQRERTHLVSTRDAQRLGPTRDKDKLAAALRELEELDRVRVTEEGRRKTIMVNPALIWGQS